MSAQVDITDFEALASQDGKIGSVAGEYRETPRPARGAVKTPRDYAMVVLQDQTEVYLGVFNTPEAHRPKAERKKLHGRMVRITGRVFRRMPTVGQGPLAPCICEISSIEIVEPN